MFPFDDVIMETVSVLLAVYEENTSDRCIQKGTIMRNFDGRFVVIQNKLSNKHSSRR